MTPGSGARTGTELDVVLPVGQVASLLGIPAMTIRSWELRYGMAPLQRSPGRHRRYTAEDIERLRRMKKLIEQGVSAQDAARLSVASSAPAARGSDADRVREAVEKLAVDQIVDLVLHRLESQGARAAWDELVVPVLHQFEARFERSGDCTDLEIVFARCASDAVAQYLATMSNQAGRRKPVLLVACPDERHLLPLVFLRAALHEQNKATVLLGPDAPMQAIVRCADRVKPSHVVLWSLTKQTAQPRLRTQLQRQGHRTLTAGPGWPATTHPANGLAEVVNAVTGRAVPPRRS